MGPNYNSNYCNVECETSNDCFYTCGCGAINIKEKCHDEGIVYDCVDTAVKCQNNKCIATEEKLGLSYTCTEYGGEWIEEYNECATDNAEANIKEFCNRFNGKYKECESACRHESTPEDCIDVCVQVCSI